MGCKLTRGSNEKKIKSTITYNSKLVLLFLENKVLGNKPIEVMS